jgi:hypothetical protein
MIILLTGQPEAGKTTLANLLPIENKFIIDGDILREATRNFDYSLAGRKLNIHSANIIALYMEARGFVPVVALVNPYISLREELKQKTNVREFYLYSDKRRSREQWFVKDFEKAVSDYTPICTDNNPEDCVKEIMTIVRSEKVKTEAFSY